MNVSKVYQMAVDSYGDVRTLVRGIPYQCPNDWKEILDSLDEDSDLYLIKEPDNPKDPLAIAAYLGDRRVGYVAASDNAKIWLYLTDEKRPCTFIERFDASFKISFENPRVLFEDMPFEEIYKYRHGVMVEQYAAFDIPFLTNPKDKNYDWYDDKIYITDLEEYIPDFRRKLAARMIILVGRKNSMGEYCYYLPYANNPVAEVRDNLIKDLIDRYGFVIALPDVPMMNIHGIIIMDLHVTFIKNTNYKDFSLTHKSEIVFNVVRDYKNNEQIAVDAKSTGVTKGKNNRNNNISNEDDYISFLNPQSTPSYSKNDYVLIKGEKKKSLVNKEYFKEIDKITSKLYNFVRQNLFPSMELFSYIKKHTPYAMQFNDFGQYETLVKIFLIKDLGRIYKGLNHSVNFATKEGKSLLLYMEKDMCDDPEVSYELFKEVCNPKTQFEAAKKLHGVIEDLTKTYYEYDIELWTNEDFMIHSLLKDVKKDLANSYLELMSEFASTVKGEAKQMTDLPIASDNEDTNSSSELSISEEVFVKFINDNIGCDVHNAPNSSWKYDHTDFLGSLSELYETYYFKKRLIGNPKFKEIFALAVKGISVNFTLDMNMSKSEIYSFINRYKKLFFPDYSLAKCKKEYGKEKYSILIDDIKPSLSISFPSIMGPGHIVFFTSFCNKSYIDKQKAKGKILTLE